MRRPLDSAVPFACDKDDRQLLEVFGHGALKAQLCAHRCEIARGFRAMQQGAELQAHVGDVTVAAYAIVDFLSLCVELISFHIRYAGGHERSPFSRARHYKMPMNSREHRQTMT